MLELYLGREGQEKIHLKLPATSETIKKIFGEGKTERTPVVILQASSSVPRLGARLAGLPYHEPQIRVHLNFLANRIRCLTQTEQDVFSAVLKIEDPKDIKEIINLSYNLDNYELFCNYMDKGEMSRMMLKRDRGLNVPPELAEILDHEKVSSAYFLRHKGDFCPSGLVLKKDGVVTEPVYGISRVDPGYEKGCLLLVRLYMEGQESRSAVLALPASENRMEIAKKNLHVENLDRCKWYVEGGDFGELEDYLPAGMELKELIQVLEFKKNEVLDGTKEKFEKLLAVLEAECPRTPEEVIEAAGNLEEYKVYLVGPDCREDFIHQTLGEKGCYPMDGFIRQFVDMEGLAKVLMEEKGAVQTEHGIILADKWRFRDFPDEKHVIRLFSPLMGELYGRNEWGDLDIDPVWLDGADLLEYAIAIREKLERENWSEEGVQGLAKYLNNHLLRQRVIRMIPEIEEYGGCLYGVLTVTSRGSLNTRELEAVIAEWCSQEADGWGEGFEQEEIALEEGELCINFWQSGDSFFILPEEEFLEQRQKQQGPQMGGM